MTTQAATPKLYTKDEIKAFTLEQCEEFAPHLDWSRRWYGDNLPRYKEKGFPRSFGNSTNIQSREEFLRMRLRLAKQERWNPDARALAAEKKAKEKAEREAKMKKLKSEWATAPKVKVDVEQSIKVVLQDCRYGGYRFWFKKTGSKFEAGQIQNDNPFGKGVKRVGTSICSQTGKYDPLEVLDALDLLESKDLRQLEDGAIRKGRAKLTITMSLIIGGNTRQPLEFGLVKPGVVGVKQYDTYNRRKLEWSWHFNIADMREALKTFEKKYKVVEVKETT